MNNTRILLPYILIFAFITGIAVRAAADNGMAIGQWRHHLPNNNIISIAESPGRIIGATPYGLVVYNKHDSSLERLSKVDGLSDFGISGIAWAGEREQLLIGYENGNLDLISDGLVSNISDILDASILGSKRINKIIVSDGRALLACDFGIVELDIAGRLILDTWFIGPHGSMVNVNDLLVTDSVIYAATNAGLLHAATDADNLADFNNWERFEISGTGAEAFNFIKSIDGRLIANRTDQERDIVYVYEDGSWDQLSHTNDFEGERNRFVNTSRGRLIVASGSRIYIFDTDLNPLREISSYQPDTPAPNHAIFDNSGTLWIADSWRGLVREYGEQEYEKIILPGPDYDNVFNLAASDGRLWIAPGFVTYGGSNSWNQNGYFLMENGRWNRYSRTRFPELTDIADIIHITVDPGDPRRAYASAWWGGMVVISTEGVVEVFDETNSTLQLRAGIGDYLRVGGTAMDSGGNLWVTNSEVDRPLSVRKSNGEWLSFTSGGAFGPQTPVREILIDNNNQKWVNLPGNGIFLFAEHSLENTNNFDSRRLTTQSGMGSLPSNRVHSMAVDHSGYVWIGTAEGVAVFFSPGRAFSGDAFNAQRIIVEEADGFAGYLLETETVTSISVDGSNKKWFGTERSGAFLMSADGRETIHHFSTNNSPLPSNNILDIEIMGETGEVFFATDRGLVSYRGFATEATTRHASEVYAYPNPVRPGYNGYIAVKGLVRNARVKITDISGKLVWESISEGGQAVWNGQDLHGRRPSTGVYLVFSTDEQGEETMVTKIMFIN